MNCVGARVADLSWQAVEKRARAGAVAILPVGAAAKAHGPHLPMNTDLLQAEWFAGNLAKRRNVLVWPTLSYGHYPAFAEYPGSCSLSFEIFHDTARHVLQDVCRVVQSGILVLNTGISTVDPLSQCVSAFPEDGKPVLANIYQGERFLTTAGRVCEQRRGGHADEVETSLMLAIAPRSVRISEARRWDAKIMQSGPFSRSDPKHPNYAPDGIYGDPTRASVEKGRLLADAILDDLHALLDDIVRPSA